MDTHTPIRIDVWSDYVCPFCYLELPALQRLQQQFGDQVKVVWRAFELRPDPKPTLDDQSLAHSLGVSGVPILVLRGPDAPWEQALALRGAVPYDTIELAVRQVLGQL